MTSEAVEKRKGDLLFVPIDVIADAKQAAEVAGLSWQEWGRSVLRRELARLAAEKAKTKGNRNG